MLKELKMVTEKEKAKYLANESNNYIPILVAKAGFLIIMLLILLATINTVMVKL